MNPNSKLYRPEFEPRKTQLFFSFFLPIADPRYTHTDDPVHAAVGIVFPGDHKTTSRCQIIIPRVFSAAQREYSMSSLD